MIPGDLVKQKPYMVWCKGGNVERPNTHMNLWRELHCHQSWFSMLGLPPGKTFLVMATGQPKWLTPQAHDQMALLLVTVGDGESIAAWVSTADIVPVR